MIQSASGCDSLSRPYRGLRLIDSGGIRCGFEHETCVDGSAGENPETQY
jgi:hypothetical protein